MKRFGRETDPALVPAVAAALHNLGLAYEHLGRRAEARRTYLELERRFGSSPDEQLQRYVAVAQQRLRVLR